MYDYQWWYEYFMFYKELKIKAVEQWVVSGYGSMETASGDAEVGPQNNLTRLEAVKTALIAFCHQIYEELPVEGAVFDDLARAAVEDDEIMDFIVRVMYSGLDLGIVEGGEAAFDEDISRAEVIKMLLLSSESYVKPSESDLETPIFEDVDADNEYYEYVQYAALHDYVTTEFGMFYPDRPIIRAEYFAMLARILHDVSEEHIQDAIDDMGLTIVNGS